MKNSTATVTVIPVVNLTINKTAVPDTVYVGEEVVFTINVTNNGPSNATNVKVTDVVPGEFVVVACDDGYNNDTGVLTVDHLEAGKSFAFTVTVVALVNGTWNNTASVVCDENSTVKNSTATVTVIPVADLEIIKLVSNDTAHKGDVVNWTVIVTNLGPNTAVNVVVNDTVPEGLIVLNVVGGKLVDGKWIVGNLTKGQNATLIIETEINTTNKTIINIVNVTSDTYDSNETNNNATNSTVVPPEADLEVNKTVSNASAHKGDAVVWTITVYNNGPDAAVNVTVTDVLPKELINPEVINLGHAGTFDGNVWFIDEIASGDSKVLKIRTVVNATNTTIVNNVNVTSDTYDPNETNNNATNSTVVPPEADLEVLKVVLNQTAHKGDVVTWMIFVLNYGPDAAVNVTVTDVWPSELVDVTVVKVSNGTLDGNVWSIDIIESGDMSYLIINTTVNASNVNITNVANVTSDTYDPDETNNEDNSTVEVPPEADLEVNKTVSNASAHKGDAVVWTITVTNNGPDAAVNVTVTDVLPKELINPEVINLGHAGTFDGNVWFIDEIASGDSKVLKIRTVVNATNTTIVNNVNVTSDTYDPNETNNNATNSTVVPPEADLEVLKVVLNQTAHKGDVVTWMIFVLNYGPDAAVNVTVTDVWPSELVDVTVVKVSNGTLDGNVWSIDIIESGDMSYLIINTTVNASNVNITNVANVTSDTYDPDLTNNEDNSTVEVPPEADLTVLKVANVTEAHVGDLVEWAIIVINMGPDAAENVTVTDVVPSELVDVVVVSIDNGTFDGNVWSIDRIENRGSLMLVINTTVAKSDVNITNVANVTSDTYDPDLTNNVDNDTVVIPPEADLEVIKGVLNLTAHNGEIVDWFIMVRNYGPDAAVNVVLEDLLPAELIYNDTVRITVGNLSADGRIWTIGNMAVDQAGILVIRTIVNTTNMSVINAVNVSSETFDPELRNNNDSDVVIVPPEADVGVVKIALNRTAHKGDAVTWLIIVYNNGPDAAENVVVTDVLPGELVDVSVVNVDEGTFDGNVWSIDRIESGVALGLVISTVVNATDVNITNPVNVTSDTYDPNMANNKNNDTVVVPPEADLEVIKTNDCDGICHNGDTVTWTITVVNNGPDDAVNAIASDVLPAGLIYVSDDSNGAYDPETGIWKMGNLSIGASAQLNIVSLVNASNVTIVNDVVVSSDTYDPKEENNQDNSSLPVDPEADLEIIKLVSDNATRRGDKITWTIIVTNNGGDTAVNTVVIDKLVNGLVYISDDSKGAYDPDSGIWKVGDLACGQSATLNIVTLVNTTNATIQNIANITSDTYDPNETNNKCNNSTTVSPIADLLITVEPNVRKMSVGDKVTFTVTVANRGPDSALNSRAFIKLPSGLKLLGFEPLNGTYDSDNAIWDMGDLNIGDEVTLLLYTQTLVSGKLVVDVYTECDSGESSYSNNNDTTDIIVETNDTQDEPPADVQEPTAMYATGNPFAMMLLALFAIVCIDIRRRI